MSLSNMRGQAAIESLSATARSLRGQAAMEYLMTYGWALLVIVIVIAILLIINPFSAPQGCRFDQIGFTCSNPVVDTNGNLFLKVANNNNNAVTIKGVKCTTDKSQVAPPAPAEITQQLARSSEIELSTLAVRCAKPDGSYVSGTSGSEFSGKVWIYYKNDEDGASYPNRITSANVVTKLVTAGASPPAANPCSPNPCTGTTTRCCVSGTSYTCVNPATECPAASS